MANYKDLENNTHWLDDEKFEYLLPHGCVKITQEEADEILNPPPTLLEQRQALKAERDAALDNLVHDFEDGRVIQVRPQDASNLQLGIATGQNEWVMVDDMPHPVTTAELQTGFDSGIAQGTVIWNDYMAALKLL